MDGKEAEIEKEKHERYLDLLKLKKLSKENYTDSEAQTINPYIVNQESQTEPISIIDASAQVT